MNADRQVVSAMKRCGQRAGQTEYQRPQGVCPIGGLEAFIESQQRARAEHTSDQQEEAAQARAEGRVVPGDDHERNRIQKAARSGEPGARKAVWRYSTWVVTAAS